ncbi:hypothetical protein [Aerosakkonema funiforme]|uniref:Uncharacterized protein n=1 Tax=Aerosakkonema funiforme FACHB-1375 TaxID=2949571 RepID=A0A926VAN2_9CYAN|nr:hypothetical protein [Aerosakkonema funiforme]MBD2180175.1 hypothetical protein [Aerosakkonema funiforme FACHB-1375]
MLQLAKNLVDIGTFLPDDPIEYGEMWGKIGKCGEMLGIIPPTLTSTRLYES